MSLQFNNATSDRVSCGSDASLDNLDPFTMIAWVYLDAKTANRAIFRKGTTNFKQLSLSGTTGNLQLFVTRGTASTSYITNNTPLATTGKWYCIACTWASASTPTSHIYVGDLATLLVEATYGTNTDGSGAQSTEAPGNYLIGNTNAVNLSWPGKIAYMVYINSELSLAALQAWQFKPRIPSSAVNKTVGFWMLGDNGTGTQPDFSGRSTNNGTVTGATFANNPPLRRLESVYYYPTAVAAGASLIPALASHHFRNRRAHAA